LWSSLHFKEINLIGLHMLAIRNTTHKLTLISTSWWYVLSFYRVGNFLSMALVFTFEWEIHFSLLSVYCYGFKSSPLRGFSYLYLFGRTQERISIIFLCSSATIFALWMGLRTIAFLLKNGLLLNNPLGISCSLVTVNLFPIVNFFSFV